MHPSTHRPNGALTKFAGGMAAKKRLLGIESGQAAA
jgi:hypothetical protein